MMTIIVGFRKAREQLLGDAYRWAVSEQQRLQIYGTPAIMIDPCDTEGLEHDSDDCVISIFRNEENGHTLMRRDWMDDQTLVYNRLVNFRQIEQIAPKAVQHMLSNGVRLYQYFDGPNGGITRPLDRDWMFS